MPTLKKKVKKKKVVKKRGGRGRRSEESEPERTIRAVQGVAVAAAVLYKVVKPHLHRLKRKKKAPGVRVKR